MMVFPGSEWLGRRIRAAADVLVQELDGEAVLLDLKSGNYFGLDEVGTRFWTLLTTEPSPQVAFDQLLTEYDVAPDRLRADLEDLLKRLLEHRLVEFSES